MGLTSTIEIQYSCKSCGLNRRKLRIPERQEGEDLTPWMNTLRNSIGRDHSATSPLCGATEITTVLIPTSKHTPIGKNPPHGSN